MSGNPFIHQIKVVEPPVWERHAEAIAQWGIICGQWRYHAASGAPLGIDWPAASTLLGAADRPLTAEGLGPLRAMEGAALDVFLERWRANHPARPRGAGGVPS